MPLRNRVEQPSTTAGLKRGDQVRVMTGRDRGKTGRVLAVNPGKRTVMVEHAGMIKRHTRPNPSQEYQGRHRGQGRADFDLQCFAAVPGVQQGRAPWAQDPARRHQGADLPPLRQHAGKVNK